MQCTCQLKYALVGNRECALACAWTSSADPDDACKTLPPAAGPSSPAASLWAVCPALPGHTF
eukprot:scaffold163228_cov21-Tisochrysis_lutea.AAC.3